MKLCKDCNFFRTPTHVGSVSEYAKCMQGMRVSPVTGELELPTQSSQWCINVRQSEKPGDCGADARFFMPSKVANLVQPVARHLS